ncbi:MAG: HPr family phosphocarrier protein [Acidiferrobacterales bacterium]|jgi:phosphocarrier protein|nr:HPr family phosphocarrier protein [Acidiferrobacterales bacterium]
MICQDVVIANKLGLHARASAKFVKLASEFSSDITLAKNGQTVNAKSIMGIMMLAAGKGTKLELCTDGSDEDAAIKAIVALIEDYFGEDE